MSILRKLGNFSVPMTIISKVFFFVKTAVHLSKISTLPILPVFFVCFTVIFNMFFTELINKYDLKILPEAFLLVAQHYQSPLTSLILAFSSLITTWQTRVQFQRPAIPSLQPQRYQSSFAQALVSSEQGSELCSFLHP